jgi:hypothetical protein
MTTIIVRSDKTSKEYLERIMPDYIDWVRDEFGFDEETLAADLYSEALHHELSQPVTITVTDSTGASSTLQVSGSMTYDALVEQVQSQSPRRSESSGAATALARAPLRIAFPNNRQSPVSASPSPDDDTAAAKLNSLRRLSRIEEREHKKLLQIDQAPLRHVRAHEAMGFDGGGNSLWKGSETEWNSVPSSDQEQKARVRQLVGLGTAGSKDPFLDAGRTGLKMALAVPYQNYVCYATSGARAYRSLFTGSTRYHALEVLLGQGRTMKSMLALHADFDGAGGEGADRGSGGEDRATGRRMSKAMAMERIKTLAQRLALQKRDFELGRKGYDESIAAMHATKAEIQTLERQYVNWFYFF